MTNASPRLVAGRYRLGAVLGRGTMGTVWSAHDEVLGRLVAVKEVLLPPGIPEAEADLLRERSLREARAIAALSHPNVVTLYDVAREGGAPFVVMELVASRSLAELLREGALPGHRVVAIGAAVAAALQAAHAAGITHRDVKPGNVLVAHDGRIKLTDFGIARNQGDQTLTATGLMLGSPAYIAPEIASGGPVTPASDLWGLGATLFAASEGRPPYDAGTAMATVAAVVQDAVPRPSCAGPLAEVISGLMVKDPACRMPLSRVRQLLGAPPEPPPGPTDPPPVVRPHPVTTALPPASAPPHGRLAADPGPLPFAVPSGVQRPRAARRFATTRAQGTAGRVVLWALAALLFFSAGAAGFGIARLVSGRAALPDLRAPATAGTSPDDGALTPRVLQITGPNGTRGARFTVTVPRGWPEFREQRVLGSTSGTVLRFVSPDGSEVIAVERITGRLPGDSVDQYLTAYLRTLAQGVPELVETQRQRLPGHGLDATVRTLEGRTLEGRTREGRTREGRTQEGRTQEGRTQEGRTQEGGELRRTTYLRLIAARAELWAVSVTVPTEREGAGRTRLFEPVVAGFAQL